MTIVVFVLILWAAAIALFYHQWGKINGSYQLDYVHANLEISKISTKANCRSAAAALSIDPNIKVSN